jgi:hypothetical protein
LKIKFFLSFSELSKHNLKFKRMKSGPADNAGPFLFWY